MALAGNADTDQYFKRGNCNQHAVGMCLVLEKTRECKMEIMADGKLRTEATFQEGADAQRNVCNALKGVHLHLIRDEERGIICPENKHKGSRMDLGHACHKVMDELILYNEMCESHEEEQGWTAWAMSVGGGAAVRFRDSSSEAVGQPRHERSRKRERGVFCLQVRLSTNGATHEQFEGANSATRSHSKIRNPGPAAVPYTFFFWGGVPAAVRYVSTA